MKMDQIARITEMEKALDISAEAVRAISDALDKFDTAYGEYQKLVDYYDSGQWRADYEADEAGEIPHDLKRGVLSQDAVYDLISEYKEIEQRITK